MSLNLVKFKVLDARATIPTRATDGSIGYDLYLLEDIRLEPGEKKLISLGISIQHPDNLGSFILPRSSSAKKGLLLANAVGVIDTDYIGELKIVLHNTLSSVAYALKTEATAQLVFIPKITVQFVEDDFIPTKRGEKGFGSTDN